MAMKETISSLVTFRSKERKEMTGFKENVAMADVQINCTEMKDTIPFMVAQATRKSTEEKGMISFMEVQVMMKSMQEMTVMWSTQDLAMT